MKPENDYGITLWSQGYFHIQDGLVCVTHKSQPALLHILQEILANGHSGPLILRFPQLIGQQIQKLHKEFQQAITKNQYKASFHAVFPIKVNPYPEVIQAVIQQGMPYQYGLEAGSKAELVLAMALLPAGHTLMVNGFKDREMIQLGFIAAAMRHAVTLTIEDIGELRNIIDLAKKDNTPIPKIGIRLKLYSQSSGHWSNSCGFGSKFGLTSSELIEAVELLQSSNLLSQFTTLHFHIGSQLKNISSFKQAIREAAHIYVALKKMGAPQLSSINIGGGFAVEYAQHTSETLCNYSLDEFANDVVCSLQEIIASQDISVPNIISESGRSIVAHHAICIAPVLGLFSQNFNENILRLQPSNPPLIQKLLVLRKNITADNGIKFLHDALDHLKSCLSLFNLGYIELQDRANAEILVQQIIKNVLSLHKDSTTQELQGLQDRLQERYLVNTSFFQSIPDYWGLGQKFPIMPLSHLDTIPARSASLLDITCDSDGEVGFNAKAPLFIHDIDPEKEDYFLGFFNIGAYQETLGMDHNLFVHPSEYSIAVTDSGFTISNCTPSDTIPEILSSLGYQQQAILERLEADNHKNNCLLLKQLLGQNGYLRCSKEY